MFSTVDFSIVLLCAVFLGGDVIDFIIADDIGEFGSIVR